MGEMDELDLLVLESAQAMSRHGGWYVPGPLGLLVEEHDPWEAERRSIEYAMGICQWRTW